MTKTDYHDTAARAKTLSRIRAFERFLYPSSGCTEAERVSAAKRLDELWVKLDVGRDEPPPPSASEPRQAKARAHGTGDLRAFTLSVEFANRFTARADIESLSLFLKRGLTADKIREAFDIAESRGVSGGAAFRYTCGICWRWIKDSDL